MSRVSLVSGATGVTLVTGATDILDAAGVLCATDIALAPGVRHVAVVVGVGDTMGGGSGPSGTVRDNCPGNVKMGGILI